MCVSKAMNAIELCDAEFQDGRRVQFAGLPVTAQSIEKAFARL